MRTAAELAAECATLRARVAAGESVQEETVAVLEDLAALIEVLVLNVSALASMVAPDEPPALAEQLRASQARSRARREGGRT